MTVPPSPQVVTVVSEEPCCEACAARQGSHASPVPTLPATKPVLAVLPVVRRADDRRTTFAGLLVSAGFLGLALISMSASAAAGSPSVWPTIHLVLAGAAGTAIASVMPFFTAALSRVAPASRWLRIGAIGAVSCGALAVTVGVWTRHTDLAVIGGATYLAGLGLTAAATFLPLRAALGRPPRLVVQAYGIALVEVTIGVTLAVSMVIGWTPVVADWAALKPAHAWLNLFGFLSVVIAATLVHLGPTVAGSRIRERRTATIALTGLVVGAPLVALGSACGWDMVARCGAAVELVGASALIGHAVGVWRDRGRWTTDAGWHTFTGGSLLAAPAWFLVATSIAAGRVLWFGAAPVGWSVALVWVPFVLGWAGQILMGSWTHLVPAIGPGDQAAHAAQRSRLGWSGPGRVTSWNIAVAFLTVGLLAGSAPLAAVGGVVIAGCVVVALGLLVGSVSRGVGGPSTFRSARAAGTGQGR